MHQTIFVIDSDETELPDPLAGVISFEVYLRDWPKLNEPKIQLINLCDTQRYLSQGYYCSLLAEARHHHVLPSIKTINSLRNTTDIEDLWMLPRELSASPDIIPDKKQKIIICMGEVEDERWKKLGKQVFQLYPAPLLSMSLNKKQSGINIKLQRCALQSLNKKQQLFCIDVLNKYAQMSWRRQSSSKQHRWDMAILVNPDESVPPSDKGAILRFVKAATKLGIRAQTVTATQIMHLSQFDALFIRETTAIDHHTYRLACKAERKGLVVIDDPKSILRCCNKVFLHDAFNYSKVPCLSTMFIDNANETTIDMIEERFSYPVVLKVPEGSYSKGVFKADNRSELVDILEKTLKESALMLAQEYMYTEYDWRIGVLNGRAIYACRYYMARNHWQIYNHGSKRHVTGKFDTLPTFEVPKMVLDAAVKATNVVGNGLYGVDIKVSNNRAYVIEVNDNPSIDHGVEDYYLSEELYMQIMGEFLRRLEMRGR